jgi:hypothetical protein
MTDERRFPIQGETRCVRTHDGRGQRIQRFPATTIPWSVAEKAFEVYHAHWPQQSLETLAARGGFGRDELFQLLSGDVRTPWPETERQ